MRMDLEDILVDWQKVIEQLRKDSILTAGVFLNPDLCRPVGMTDGVMFLYIRDSFHATRLFQEPQYSRVKAALASVFPDCLNFQILLGNSTEPFTITPASNREPLMTPERSLAFWGSPKPDPEQTRAMFSGATQTAPPPVRREVVSYQAPQAQGKAIETVYKGYRLRSRLEARWCVFFDRMGIKFDYELEGYDLGEAGYYLPDFWLPQVNMWAEVKPQPLSEAEHVKCRALVVTTGYPCLMLVGAPDFVDYDAWEPEYQKPENMVRIPYSLTSEYLNSEHRFFCMGYFDSPDMYGDDYARAVQAARSARFEHGEKG